MLGYTDGYTSPEQYIIALDRESVYSLPRYSAIDEKSDIYSVGATFYHLVTGKKIKNHREIPDAGLLTERTSEAFAETLLRALQIDPADRFQSAYDMFQAFQGIARKDKRYQALLRKQHAAYVGLAVLLAGFIILGGYGIHMRKLEMIDRYNGLVEQQKDFRKEQAYEKEEEKYRKPPRCFRQPWKVIIKMPALCMNRRNMKSVSASLNMISWRMRRSICWTNEWRTSSI